ncbi:MAG: class III poly(R)-hydroxyalkanoic acid synthase subunit PhaC [Thaumarchaeota archaeon]|nr:class III poly(R)-hydroxyalkanoic acid synthase subunit PhaC [Nitrososphaerota archaeon]
MESELRIDPRIIEEFLQLNKNILEAPKLVAAPDEINLEMSPYDVVYTEGKMRLLHFNSNSKRQARTPLLIAYAVINRYHILDIHPQKSWVRNLMDQGLDVYMIDWGTPSEMDRYLGFDDYVNTYMENCVNFVSNESSVEKVTLQGYCTGGTLAAVYASLHPEKIRNLVLTAPVIDGSKDHSVVANLAKHIDVDKMVDVIGNVPPEFMYYVFSILKPFEQGFEKYVQFFKNIHNKDYVENFIRVEKWLSETPPIPGELFREWIKNVYQENLLIRNKMVVSGRTVNLRDISMPVFTQVAVGDHLVSPECSMPIHYSVSSEDKMLRIYATGHVGMIASSFSQKKVLPELGEWIKNRSEK